MRTPVTTRRVGPRGLLLELQDLDAVLALTDRIDDAIGSGRLPHIEAVVPAFETVLIRALPGCDVTALEQAVLALANQPTAPRDNTPTGEVVIPVRYDGPDLEDVASATGLTRAEVIAAHVNHPWTAAFAGFVPGLCYLTGGDSRLEVPRRHESRPKVSAGSVALAGGFSTIYPSTTPGGWQIIGTTDTPLWRPDDTEPALIRPGTVVRFVAEETSPVTIHPVAAPEHQDRNPASTPQPLTQGLEVVRPGPLSVIQDHGRPGHARIGVAKSGAADQGAYKFGNALVGNEAGAAAIECTMGGLTVRAQGDHLVAITGAEASASIDGESIEHARAVTLRDGQTLSLRTPKLGLRTYLAVRGGIDTPPILGSRSTDVLSGLGLPPLRKGQQLPIGTICGTSEPILDAAAPRLGTAPCNGPHTLRVTLGPRDDWFTNPADLADGEWIVSPHSNRVGLRLDRAPQPDPATDPPADQTPAALTRVDTRELRSEGVVLGAIQVPPSGQPVVFLADHPVTGGYPVIAVVVDNDLDCAAQIRPGQRIRFQITQP